MTTAQYIPIILIVDDTLANLELLSNMLKEYGYEARLAPNGKLALAAAQAEPPDLILLDIKMPQMDGFEVCKRLKADETLKDIPVIFITALNDTKDIVKAFSLGAVDYITKPFHIEEIQVRVRNHIKICNLQRQLHAQNQDLERKVIERTQDLAKANARLQELDHLKDDFLRMLSFEIRTPVNGVLGIGELIIDLVPECEDSTQYINAFHDSSLRLRNLIEDTNIIVNLNKLPLNGEAATSFSILLDKVRDSLPQIEISLDDHPALKSVFISGENNLLQKAMVTIINLATVFSQNKQHVQIKNSLEAKFLRLELDIDNLGLSDEQCTVFFEIESNVRAVSYAEDLGLAPVVAQSIISAFGGEMRIVKTEENCGYLEVLFLMQPKHS